MSLNTNRVAIRIDPAPDWGSLESDCGARYIRGHMSQLEIVIEELKQLPPANVEQVAAFVHELRESRIASNRRAFADTAGCMSPEEADEFQRLIDEQCERIDPDNSARLD